MLGCPPWPWKPTYHQIPMFQLGFRDRVPVGSMVVRLEPKWGPGADGNVGQGAGCCGFLWKISRFFFFAQRAKRNTTSCSKMMQIDANWFTVSLRFLDSTFGFCMFLHLRSLCDFSGSDTDEMPLLSPDRLMWWDYWTSESWWQPPTAGAASNRWVFGVSAFKGAHMAASLLFQ